MNLALKAPSWAYDSWHARYRPYAGLEITAVPPPRPQPLVLPPAAFD